MQADLPPFRGPYSECPKCGSPRATLRFKPRGVCHPDDHDRLVTTNQVDPNPRICRTCAVCGYSSDERTLDPADAPPGDASPTGDVQPDHAQPRRRHRLF